MSTGSERHLACWEASGSSPARPSTRTREEGLKSSAAAQVSAEVSAHAHTINLVAQGVLRPLLCCRAPGDGRGPPGMGVGKGKKTPSLPKRRRRPELTARQQLHPALRTVPAAGCDRHSGISLGTHHHSTRPWARAYPPSSSSRLREEPRGGSAPDLHSPADDLLVLGPDEVLLLRRQDAQGEFLPCPALPIHYICALVHVDGALREGCWLRGEGERSNI